MRSIYKLKEELQANEINDCSNYAQEQLIAHAEEQGYNVEITVENGEVYLNGEYSDHFGHIAQEMFDGFFGEKAARITA